MKYLRGLVCWRICWSHLGFDSDYVYLHCDMVVVYNKKTHILFNKFLVHGSVTAIQNQGNNNCHVTNGVSSTGDILRFSFFSFIIYLRYNYVSFNRVVMSKFFCYCLLNSCFWPVFVILYVVRKYHLDFYHKFFNISNHYIY